eukprot:TRINITY_DN22506_c0_g1_i1.p2 TRINITY_DN22506_c0_g1~~TRINITY_DN22506_c0_g1_i1.p2  ORF type:complete len:204 (-),score=36.74 TRINITY_DN22506_c0_g1_i1:186-797(-)
MPALNPLLILGDAEALVRYLPYIVLVSFAIYFWLVYRYGGLRAYCRQLKADVYALCGRPMPPAGAADYHALAGGAFEPTASPALAAIPEELLGPYSQLPDGAIPSEFRCPITLRVMRDPVVAEDGHTYERSAIQEHLSRGPHAVSPISRAPLASRILIPNIALRAQIIEAAELLARSTSSALAAASFAPSAPAPTSPEGREHV